MAVQWGDSLGRFMKTSRHEDQQDYLKALDFHDELSPIIRIYNVMSRCKDKDEDQQDYLKALDFELNN